MSSDLEQFMSGVAEYDKFADDVDLAYLPKEIGAGEFTCLFEKFTMAVVTKDNVEINIAKATFLILAGPREGDSFTDVFWFPANPDKAEMAQRRLLILARTLSARTVRSLGEGAQILKDAAGEATLLISIEHGRAKTTGNEFFNVNYKGRVDLAPAVAPS